MRVKIPFTLHGCSSQNLTSSLWTRVVLCGLLSPCFLPAFLQQVTCCCAMCLRAKGVRWGFPRSCWRWHRWDVLGARPLAGRWLSCCLAMQLWFCGWYFKRTLCRVSVGRLHPGKDPLHVLLYDHFSFLFQQPFFFSQRVAAWWLLSPGAGRSLGQGWLLLTS